MLFVDVQFKCGKCSETFEDCFPAMLHLEVSSNNILSYILVFVYFTNK